MNFADIDHNKCVGCTACVNICPTNCIKMALDKDGFLYPKVDSSQCINCGKCYNVCPAVNGVKLKKKPLLLGMINKNNEVRMKSSSGGVFAELAKYIIDSGGYVCAACIDDDYEVKHIIIHETDNIEKCMRSKYVQSNLNHCYKEVKRLLENNKTVMFVGTPCQIGGLHNYLGKSYKNLYLIDLVCHGVPSPKIWGEYIHDMIGEDKALKVSFRDMELGGWKNYGMRIVFEKASDYVDVQTENIYMQGFLQGYFDRVTCYECQFKGFHRASDITLGDFWRVENYFAKCDDNKGISLVYVNSEKGKRLVEMVKKRFWLKKLPRGSEKEANDAYWESLKFKDNRKKFYKKYLNGKSMKDIMELEIKKQRR